jgi:hypothetical protein
VEDDQQLPPLLLHKCAQLSQVQHQHAADTPSVSCSHTRACHSRPCCLMTTPSQLCFCLCPNFSPSLSQPCSLDSYIRSA